MRASPEFGVSPILRSTEPDGGPDRYLHIAIFLDRDQMILDEHLRVANAKGHDSVSQPFEYQLELHGDTVPGGDDYSVEQFLNRSVTWAVNTPPAHTPQCCGSKGAFKIFKEAVNSDSAGPLSVFNGIITQFAMKGPGVYSIVIRPALWRLSLTNDYRVHPSVCIRDLLAKLLSKHGVDYSLDGLSGKENLAVSRTQDWLQAGETDLDLFHRLLRKAHIYYYFLHTPRGHKLILANTPAYRSVFPDDRPLRYAYTQNEGLEQDDLITDITYEQQLQPSSVRTTFTRQQAAWEKDTVASLRAYQANSKDVAGDLPFHVYKPYQYGGSEDETNHYARQTQETLDASKTSLSGTTTCTLLKVGHKFSITDSPCANAKSSFSPNPVLASVAGGKFVVTEIQHEADDTGHYRGSFKATEADAQICPFDIRDTQQGLILGTVVNKNNEIPQESWKYYEKSVFVWGNHETSDSQSDPKDLKEKGVFVRFSTDEVTGTPVWIKLAPHMQTVPELGACVLISRANDESELPEIQSIVQSNGSYVVTPERWTANTHVGSSYSTNYGDSKSVRYRLNTDTDLSGAIKIVEDACANGEYRDSSYSNGASYSYSTAENGKNGLLSRSISKGSTYSHHFGAIGDSYTEIDKTKSEQVHKSAFSNTIVSGLSENNSDIGESKSKSIVQGDTHSKSIVKGDSQQSSQVKGDSNSHTVLEGKSTSVHKVKGTSKNKQTFDGLSTNETIHNAGLINDTMIVGASVTKHTVLGLNQSTSILGVSQSTSAVAAQNNINLIGRTLDLSATGMRESISSVEVDGTVHSAGVQASVEIVGAGLSYKEYGVQLQMTQQDGLKLEFAMSWLVL